MAITPESRRRFLRLASVSALTPLLSRIAWASAPEALSEDDPTAKALGYHADAASVDKATNPSFRPGSTCLNCMQFKSGEQDVGSCALFPGKSVSADGWCKAWVKKP